MKSAILFLQENHPHPGERYSGTKRKAYLPDNKEGQEILDLLYKAFQARLIFTISHNSETKKDTIMWNDIPHKITEDGG